jgi:organic radical activating enzyme
MKLNNIDVFTTSRCNFSCSHCAVKSHHFGNNRTSIGDADACAILDFIINNEVEEIRFTGGEPTLEIDTINTLIVKALQIKPKLKTSIMTNSWFSSTYDKCKDTLKKIDNLSSILISYDKFHSQFLPLSNLDVIKKYCDDYKISLNIAYCIESPMDLIEMKKIEDETGIECSYQNILPIKHALNNNCYYKYNYFDKKVLQESCPNTQSLIYYPGLGFSQCCGSLLFNNSNKIAEKVCSAKIEKYMVSRFFILLNNYNFGDLVEMAGIKEDEYISNHTISCNLCNHIFCRLFEQGGLSEK